MKRILTAIALLFLFCTAVGWISFEVANMTNRTTQATEIAQDRLVSNADLAAADEKTLSEFNEIGLSLESTIPVQSGQILIVDPLYLGDIDLYSNGDDRATLFLKKNSVVLMNFGGDVSGPVVRCSGGAFKIVLTHQRIDEEGRPIFQGDSEGIPRSALVAEQSPAIDSGTFLFIDYSAELRALLRNELSSLRDDMYLLLDVPPGRYWIGYEQWDIDPDYPYPAWYRNIVVMPADS